MEQTQPQYKMGESVHDSQGNCLGEVVHRYFNDYTQEWSYTLADNMSWHTGRFTYYTPSDQ